MIVEIETRLGRFGIINEKQMSCYYDFQKQK